MNEWLSRVNQKLIKGTHHDQLYGIYNPHKILGFSALAHFLYRYAVHWKTGQMRFSHSYYDLIYIAGHLTLSLTSFLFPVSPNRNFNHQIIWKELQLHNISFTARSCAIFAYNLVYPEQNLWHRFFIVMMFHYVADLITKYYHAGNTMRDMAMDNRFLPQWTKTYFDRFYAFSQFGATAVLIIPNGCTPEYAFMSMFAIQLSTFLMTLRLKGIINNDMWHIVYTICLLMNLQVGVTCSRHRWAYMYLVLMMFYTWRIYLRGNKYLGWLIIIGLYSSIQSYYPWLFLR